MTPYKQELTVWLFGTFTTLTTAGLCNLNTLLSPYLLTSIAQVSKFFLI